MAEENLNLPASKLALGPEESPQDKDFRSSFHWRIFRIIAEFVDGWQFLADFKKIITFFGSARNREGDRWYEEARKLGNMLAKNGYDVVTGGGPGIMEAGNRGAFEAKHASGDVNMGDSIGLNIKLPYEQRINKYVNKSVAFHYLFVRKVMLSYYAQDYILFPGGYGTLDEAFELLTLLQVGKIPKAKLTFVGKEFWGPLAKWLEQEVLGKFEAIDKEDLNLFTIVDSAEEAYEAIKKTPERKEF